MKNLLLSAAVLAMTLTLSAQAADFVSRDIVLGPYNVSSASTPLPMLSIIPNTRMEFHILNPTANPLNFSVPDLGINETVPANSERRISLEPARTANLTPGQQVAYYIIDANGNQIASSYMINERVAYGFEQTTTTVTQTTETVEPEKSAPQERSSTVRGYW